ncbi:MAG: hypothetical protein KIT11_05935 [Fimbriimonadaceae bacterium]|nr:hypothetical protein [Fimbriimonadaceae bacterium]QYK55897.1 MAG: hypothetical protein KF733_00125 [Fimbriimonadaceae bacterium]
MLALLGLLSGPNQVAVATEGGFLLKVLHEGRVAYVRTATLCSREGRLSTVGGDALLPAVFVGDDFSIAEDGTVTSKGVVAGRLQAYVFNGAPSPDENGFYRSPERPRTVPIAAPLRLVVGDAKLSSGPTPKPQETVAPTVVTAPPAEPATADALPEVLPDPAYLAEGGIEVALNPETELDTETYTLGQIATVYAKADMAPRLSAAELGKTPAFGVKFTVDRTWVVSRLRLAGLKVDKLRLIGPTRGKVVRKGQKLTHDMFLKAALDAVAAKQAGSWTAAKDDVEMSVPTGSLRLVVEGVELGRSEGSVTVAVYVDGRRFNSRVVRLKNTAPIVDLRPGTIVNVRVNAGGVQVTTKCTVVQADAKTGQVTVRTQDTNALLVGKLAADGVVEVQA